MLEDLDFVAVRIGDEGHLLSVFEFLPPVGGPEVEFEAEAFKHFAIGGDIVDADAGVDQILGEFDFKLGRVSELQIVAAPRDLQVRELVSARRLIGPPENLETAGLTIPVDGLLQIGDTNTGVVECDSHVSGL